MKLPRNAQLWWGGLRASTRRVRRHRFDPSRAVTVHVMVGDHYEPYWGKPSDQVARDRVTAWAEAWPLIADITRDDAGRSAQWTFFYPQEEYRAELLEPLALMTRAGIADVEIHIHHDGEGEQDFVERMQGFIDVLRGTHGLLHDVNGRPGFGFIHGNWALDNSRPDGRWCGLNNELTLLRKLGCYADFTMPAAPDPCQTTLVNAIYWAVDDPLRPKSHDRGPLVDVGVAAPADALLCIQGPLALRAHPRWRVVPTLEVGELAGYARPSRARATRWLGVAPRIGNDVFVKLYTHGAPEKNAHPMLGGDIAQTFAHIHDECRARGWQLAYCTAYELAQQVERSRAGA
jgi:hypothetical protein